MATPRATSSPVDNRPSKVLGDRDPRRENVLVSRNNTVKHGAIYVRQSLTREGSESIETQIEVCKAAMERMGFEVVEVLAEPPSTSGYKERGRNRKKWKDLLQGFRDGRWQMVMAYKTDRLTRGGGPGWAPLLEVIEAAGLDIDRAIATPNGFMSEFEIGIRASMDRESSKRTSDNIKDLIARKAVAGKPHIGGHRLYGFEHDYVTIRPSEAAVLREMAKRYLAGHAFREIAWWLNEQGIPATLGGQWTGVQVRSRLTRLHYGGIREHRGEQFKGDWPAIFEPDEWAQLQTVIRLRRSKSEEPLARKYLLTGLVYCGVCGLPLCGSNKRATRHQPKKRGYHCRYQGATEERFGCGRISRIADPLEHFVRESVFYRLDSPELAALLQPDGDDGELTALLDQRTMLQTRYDGFTDDYATGLLDKAQYARAADTSRQELARLDAQIETAKHSALKATVPVGQTLREAWENCGSDSWRRNLLSLLIKKITLLPANKGARKPLYRVGDAVYKFAPDCVVIDWRV